jgi:hypothetical protein
MKIYDEIIQGSDEWKAVKCGVPSASNFDKIVTTKGERSKQAEKYLYRLAGERITGTSEETFQSAAMQKGVEMEAEARSYYEVVNDTEVKQVGFCLADGFGSSPDGLIGEDGGLELKVPNLATHVGYLLDGKLPTEYFCQVQGNLLVTGRKWWDFMSYASPSIKPFIIRVERDGVFIKKLEAELKLFCQELEEVVKKIK